MKNRRRPAYALCGTLLLLAIVLLVPAYALAHMVTPPAPQPDPQPAPTDPAMTGGATTPTDTGANAGTTPADPTQTQTGDTAATMATDTGTYWLGYLFLGIMMLVVAFALFVIGRAILAT